MSSEKIVIDVRDLRKRYEVYPTPRDRLKEFAFYPVKKGLSRITSGFGFSHFHNPPHYFHEFWALDGISFQVQKGETLGIIGRNGSGKSTLLQILAGTLSPTSGEVNVFGKTAALLELGSGFNPEFTGRENVFLNGLLLGFTKKEIEARYDQIVEFAEIGEFIDQPVKTYSSGMFVRLAFAVQAHIDASIIIIDEALAVGDVFFRQKCYARLEKMKQSGAAILLVSHSMPDIEQYCENALLLEQGRMLFMGPSSETAKRYYLRNQEKQMVRREEREEFTGEDTSILPGWTSERPPQEAFLNLMNKAQVSNGEAHCTGIALLNFSGESCNCFRQGDKATFWAEFHLAHLIEVPIFGLVLKNERGVIVHGKNSWQFEGDVHKSEGRRIVCRYELSLDLAPGEYTFEVALSSVTHEEWRNRHSISHEEMSALYVDICHITDAGHFAIGLGLKNGISVLSHHGVADLPGKMELMIVKEVHTDKMPE